MKIYLNIIFLMLSLLVAEISSAKLANSLPIGFTNQSGYDLKLVPTQIHRETCPIQNLPRSIDVSADNQNPTSLTLDYTCAFPEFQINFNIYAFNEGKMVSTQSELSLICSWEMQGCSVLPVNFPLSINKEQFAARTNNSMPLHIFIYPLFTKQ